MDKSNAERVKELMKVHKSTKDKRLAYKVNALILLYKNYSYPQIEDALLLDERTIRRYRKIYESEGVLGLLNDKYKGGNSFLSESQKEELTTALDRNLFSTAKSICQYVDEKFDVKYTSGGMVKLLKSMGYSYKKTKNVPSKADVGKQKEFVDQYEKLRKNLKKDEKIYFMDGVHPTHNVSPGYCWIRKGEERGVKSNTGRERVNINGVYSPLDHEIIVREDERINSDSTINLLKMIEQRHPELRKIFIIRDNARYYCSAPVKEYLEDSKIEFVALPSYSPNLNLIERLWKFFKSKVVINHYYEKFDVFRQTVLAFFEQDIGNYLPELDSLMTEKFHIIEPV